MGVGLIERSVIVQVGFVARSEINTASHSTCLILFYNGTIQDQVTIHCGAVMANAAAVSGCFIAGNLG